MRKFRVLKLKAPYIWFKSLGGGASTCVPVYACCLCVCMYLCVCLCVSVYVSVYVGVCVSMFVSVSVCICMCMCACVYACQCAYVCAHVCSPQHHTALKICCTLSTYWLADF